MSKNRSNQESQSNTLYTVLCAGREYKTNFKEGDRVIGNGSGYAGVMIIEGVDEFLTRALKKLHWEVSSEDYVLGKRKVNNAEPVSDNEIEPCT